MRFAALLVFLFLPSCNLMKTISENSEKVGEGIDNVVAVSRDIRTRYEEMTKRFDRLVETYDSVLSTVKDMGETVVAFTESMKAADSDGDGKLSRDELLAWLFGSGGVVSLAGVALKRSLNKRNESSDALKAAMREETRQVAATLENLKGQVDQLSRA